MKILLFDLDCNKRELKTRLSDTSYSTRVLERNIKHFVDEKQMPLISGAHYFLFLN